MNYTELTIETERLRLVPLSKEYMEEVFREFTDEITTYMYPKPNESMEALEKHYDDTIAEMVKGEDYSFTIIDKQTKEFLGRGGLHKPHTNTPELGIWLKKTAHGNKYGQEAMKAVKEWAEKHLTYDYLMYPVDKRNVSSRKVAEALGGEIKKEYKQINMAGNELDEVEYHIYPNKPIT